MLRVDIIMLLYKPNSRFT